MKTLSVIFVLLLSQAGLAKDQDLNFQSLITRHAEMVDNNGESFIDLELTQHAQYAELGEVVAKISSNYSYGLEGMNLIRIYNDIENEVMNHLFDGYYGYFCTTFDPENWGDDEALCKEKTKTLLGAALLEADAVYVLDAFGDYYGDWHEVVVILQNYDTAESLSLRFDILHEI